MRCMYKIALRINGILFLLYLLYGYIFTGTPSPEQDDMTGLAIIVAILVGGVTFGVAILMIRGVQFLLFDVFFAGPTRKKKMVCPHCANQSVSTYDRYQLLTGKTVACYKCGTALEYDRRMLIGVLALTQLASLAVLIRYFQSCCLDVTVIAIMGAYAVYLVAGLAIILFMPVRQISAP